MIRGSSFVEVGSSPRPTSYLSNSPPDAVELILIEADSYKDEEFSRKSPICSMRHWKSPKPSNSASTAIVASAIKPIITDYVL